MRQEEEKSGNRKSPSEILQVSNLVIKTEVSMER